jgi:hypothetical protein
VHSAPVASAGSSSVAKLGGPCTQAVGRRAGDIRYLNPIEIPGRANNASAHGSRTWSVNERPSNENLCPKVPAVDQETQHRALLGARQTMKGGITTRRPTAAR